MNKFEKVVEIVGKDTLKVVEYPFVHTAQFVTILGEALVDEPKVRTAVIDIVKAGEKIRRRRGSRCARKGTRSQLRSGDSCRRPRHSSSCLPRNFCLPSRPRIRTSRRTRSSLLCALSTRNAHAVIHSVPHSQMTAIVPSIHANRASVDTQSADQRTNAGMTSAGDSSACVGCDCIHYVCGV